nr:MAG TPA: hypothetical protein [Caudoviricetes sp.]
MKCELNSNRHRRRDMIMMKFALTVCTSYAI